MKYAIFDTCDLSSPFVFHDQDNGTQEPAIFETRSKADRMAHMMNSVIKDRTFIVKVYKLERMVTNAKAAQGHPTSHP